MLDFIAYNRINSFVNRLVTVSETITDTKYVDNSPIGIFTGPKGTILQKSGNILSYKYPGDTNFTILNYASTSIGNLLSKYGVILNRGINKNATWVKMDSETGTSWQNRGANTSSCQICEIVPSSPCLTPVVTYFVPPTPTPTNTPTPTPTPNFTYLSVYYLQVETLIIANQAKCEPGETTPGYYGEIIICENYIYVYDGTKWKRVELTVYY